LQIYFIVTGRDIGFLDRRAQRADVVAERRFADAIAGVGIRDVLAIWAGG